MQTTRIVSVGAAAAIAAAAMSLAGRAAGPPACAPDNGGITLPAGFCAAVVADNIGHARHLVVAPNGDVFAATQGGRGGGGGVVALHDADGDGTLETREQFGSGSATGIGLRNGYIYYATPTQIIRYKLPAGQIKPTGEAEIVATDLPERRQHADKGLAFDGRGGVYVNFGSPSNACQQPDRQPNVAGQDPCPLLETYAGIFRFDENKLGQKPADGKRIVTGLRQEVGLTWHDSSLWFVMHNRDGLDTMWPGKFTAEQNAEWPAEYLGKGSAGANFGWPYCFYNNAEHKLVNNPEYGGDGKKDDRCGSFTPPAVAFPGHWAPNDVLFYTGTQFPAPYRGGAFVAFHGSWNRAPLPQAGYNVTFVPFSGGKPGKYEVFADGFAGKSPLANPGDAAARPGGLAIGPDGSLYVTEDMKGRIWRVMYKGK
jgi:glucose/arabinose dehydrogenase